jgi:hypothetical protein
MDTLGFFGATRSFLTPFLVLTLPCLNGALVVKLPDQLDSLDIIAQVKHARYFFLFPGEIELHGSKI